MNWTEKLGYTQHHLTQLRSCGYLYYKQGQFEIAKLMFEALRLLAPKNSYDLNMLGAIYLQLGELEKALCKLDEALASEPAHLPSLLNRFKVLLLLGQKQSALELAPTLLQNNQNPIKRQVYTLLKSYKIAPLTEA